MAYSALELVEAFIKAGELSDALDVLNDWIAQTPTEAAARRLRAAVLLRTGDLAAALQDLAALETPTAADYASRSVILERSGDLRGALAAVEMARGLDPESERLAERQVGLLLALGEIQAARQIAAQQPHTWRWLQWLGDLAAQAEDHSEAASHYSSALQQLESHFDIASGGHAAALKARLLLVRAESLQQLQRFAEAEADYAEAQAHIPNDPIIPFKRGLLAAERGDHAAGVLLCREALAKAKPAYRDSLREMVSAPQFKALAAALSDVL